MKQNLQQDAQAQYCCVKPTLFVLSALFAIRVVCRTNTIIEYYKNKDSFSLGATLGFKNKFSYEELYKKIASLTGALSCILLVTHTMYLVEKK